MKMGSTRIMTRIGAGRSTGRFVLDPAESRKCNSGSRFQYYIQHTAMIQLLRLIEFISVHKTTTNVLQQNDQNAGCGSKAGGNQSNLSAKTFYRFARYFFFLLACQNDVAQILKNQEGLNERGRFMGSETLTHVELFESS